MTTGNRRDWARVGKDAFSITVGSLLSVALYGLLYWAVGLGNIRYSIRMVVSIAWAVATVILLRKSVREVRHQVRSRRAIGFRYVIYFVWALGLLGSWFVRWTYKRR